MVAKPLSYGRKHCQLIPQQRIYELIARKLAGEATPAELEELQTLMQGNGHEEYLYDVLDTYWHQQPDPDEGEGKEEESRFQRILAASDGRTAASVPMPARHRWRRWVPYAAALVIVAGSSYGLYRYKRLSATDPGDPLPVSEVVASRGSRSRMLLPDGTQVFLNAGSRLTYNSHFNTLLREVNLEGEAFFEVTHDAQRPFIVHTSGIDIKVLGTAFNVKSYAADATIETTLLRGSIEVVRKNDPTAPKVILRPHEKLVFNKEEPPEVVSPDVYSPPTTDSPDNQPGISILTLPANKPDSVIKETSWLYNKLNFDGDSFEELAIKLERWYDVHITIRSEKLKDMHLKGSFGTESLPKALEYLQLIVPFTYKMEGKEVIIQ
ncbi:FecR family protein [Paraflavitalea pollutisoli]|uniref:FecR family protein n=1 Tax=Paraflavitalea pollutisoli TaxID=3034143 RepID=UPI0023EDA9F5|nr:FecR domain-containing protein [Paraflavitalea sp. H1-2-19X]